ncbi:MAG: TPR repeat protein [Cryomorphaceae bacterium]|jgi:TPR repeat protein
MPTSFIFRHFQFQPLLASTTFKIHSFMPFKQLSNYLIGLVMLASLSVTNAYTQSDYSAGMQAYLDGEFKQAQSYWLKSAKAKNAKSMFNLGLLHQRRHLSNADDGKAEKWFRLSARNGYAAAYYHLAMWLSERGSSKIEINKLLLAADKAGFAPASVKLGKTPSKPLVLASKATQKAAMPDVISNAPAQRYRREAWISSLPSSQWTIQMLAFNEQVKVRNFIDDHGLHVQAAYFAESDSESVLYKLIYGAYGSKQQAEFARQNLSSDLKQYGPWLRPVVSVQSVINAQ